MSDLRKIQEALSQHQRQIAVHKTALLNSSSVSSSSNSSSSTSVLPRPTSSGEKISITSIAFVPSPIVASANAGGSLIQDAAGQRSPVLRQLRRIADETARRRAPEICRRDLPPCRAAFANSSWHLVARAVEMLRGPVKESAGGADVLPVVDELVLCSAWPFAALDRQLSIRDVASLSDSFLFSSSRRLQCELLLSKPQHATTRQVADDLRHHVASLAATETADEVLLCSLPSSLLRQMHVVVNVWRPNSEEPTNEPFVDSVVEVGEGSSTLCLLLDLSDDADDDDATVLLLLPSSSREELRTVSLPLRAIAPHLAVNYPSMALLRPVAAAGFSGAVAMTASQTPTEKARTLLSSAGFVGPVTATQSCRFSSHVVAIGLARALFFSSSSASSIADSSEIVDKGLLQNLPLECIVESGTSTASIAQFQELVLRSSDENSSIAHSRKSLLMLQAMHLVKSIEAPSMEELMLTMRELRDDPVNRLCFVLYDRAVIHGHRTVFGCSAVLKSQHDGSHVFAALPEQQQRNCRSGWALLTAVAEHPHVTVTAADGAPGLLGAAAWTADLETLHAALSSSTVDGSGQGLHGLVVVKKAPKVNFVNNGNNDVGSNHRRSKTPPPPAPSSRLSPAFSSIPLVVVARMFTELLQQSKQRKMIMAAAGDDHDGDVPAATSSHSQQQQQQQPSQLSQSIAVVSPEDILRCRNAALTPRALLLMDRSPSVQQLHLVVSDYILACSGKIGALFCHTPRTPTVITESADGGMTATTTFAAFRHLLAQLRIEAQARPLAILAAFNAAPLNASGGAAVLEVGDSTEGRAKCRLHGVASASGLSPVIEVSELLLYEALLARGKGEGGLVVVTGAHSQSELEIESLPSRFRPISVCAAPLFPLHRQFSPAPHLAALSVALAHLEVDYVSPEALLAASSSSSLNARHQIRPGRCGVSNMSSDMRSAELCQIARDFLAKRGTSSSNNRTLRDTAAAAAVDVQLVQVTEENIDGVILDALSDHAVLICIYDVAILHSGGAGGGRTDPPQRCRSVSAALVEGIEPAAAATETCAGRSATVHLCDMSAESTVLVVDAALLVRACRSAADGGDRKDLGFHFVSVMKKS